MSGIPMRAVAAWEPSDRAPIVLGVADTVTVGRRDTDWPGFVWCTDSAGVAGWVPEELLATIGTGRAEATENYSAVELAVQPGSEVVGHRVIAGWRWCVAHDGAEGWVPERVLSAAD